MFTRTWQSAPRSQLAGHAGNANFGLKEKTNIMNITERVICAWISDDDEGIVVVDGDGEADEADEDREADG